MEDPTLPKISGSIGKHIIDSIVVIFPLIAGILIFEKFLALDIN